MGKNKKNHTSVDILKLTSSEIFNDINEIDFNNKYKFKGSLPDSLMLRKLRSISKKSEFHEKGIHEYTELIIDIDLSEDAFKKLDTTHTIKKKGKEIEVHDRDKVYGHKKIRQVAYDRGIKLKDTKTGRVYEYVNFLRGSNKSKTGQCLFILKEYYDEMISWCRMYLTFTNKEEIDIASLRAYEALVCSSIEDTIIIDPKKILLIDDVKGYCQEIQSVMTMKEKDIENIETKTMDIYNDIFDGQSLGSSELFKQKEKNGKQQGFYLLRNHWLKTAMFNGEIQKFYHDNDITTVCNRFGEPMAAKDVLLITTPNSCKFFKFSDKICRTLLSNEEFMKIEHDKKAQDKVAWDYWKQYIDDIFGICQTEHESKHVDGNWSKTSYQFLGTMPLTTDDLEDLSQPCVDDINLLATNVSAFREYIGADEVDLSKNMMYNLLSVNDKVQYTDMFYKYRARVRNDYAKELKRGRLLSKGDYAVVCSNPYEMLLASTGKKISKENLLHNRIDLVDDYGNSLNQYIYPIWCNGYNKDQELCIFRSPHVCSGNVTVVKNIYKPEFDRYFPNFNKNIVIINSYDCGILDRLQGMDMDSDKCVIFTSETMLKRAKECLKYPTPVNKIDADKDLRPLTSKNMAIIDNKICGNSIGLITNFSMKYNSYYWYYLSKNIDGRYDKKLEQIYNIISCASSLAGSEIDKSKKLFSFSAKQILKNLESYDVIDDGDMYIKYEYNYNQSSDSKNKVGALKKCLEQCIKDTEEYKELELEIKELTHNKVKIPKVPIFFRHIFKVQSDTVYSNMNCPMNRLIEILKKGINKAYKAKDENGDVINLDIKEILSDVPLTDANTHQIEKFATIAEQLKKSIAAIYSEDAKKEAKEEKKEIVRRVTNLKSKALEDVSNKTVHPVTIASIIYQTYAKKKFIYIDSNGKEVGYGFILLSLLSKAYPGEFKGAIQCNNGKFSELIEYKHGDIERFGKRFIEVDTNFYDELDNYEDIA